LSDRRAEIIFMVLVVTCWSKCNICPSLCSVFCLFTLLVDYLTETFATEAKNSSLYAGNLLKSFYTDRHKVMERL